MSHPLLEEQYIYKISPYLDRFKRTGNNSFNFRCNVCGDSKKSKTKARGHILFYRKKGIYVYKCHNCGVSYSFQYYLKLYFEDEYKQLRKDMFLSNSQVISEKKKLEQEKVINVFSNDLQKNLKSLYEKSSNDLLVPLDSITNKNHICLEYVKSRKLPKSKYHRLFYTDNFKKFIESVVPEDLRKNKHYPDDKRLVIVLKNANGDIFGYVGRTLESHDIRYCTVILSSGMDYHKCYGLDSIDTSKHIIVVEGAIDSLFLDNCISLNGGDTNTLDVLIKELNIKKEQLIIVLDNECRHKDTIKRMKRTINDGYNIVIWDKINSDKKDINDMVLSGLSPEDIQQYILNNFHNGLTALLKLTYWKKL